ncbi:MAG: radical SAM protein [Desulfovibrionaceae bacterium]
MAKRKKPSPRLVAANERGEILDHPEFLMLCRRGRELFEPRPDEIMSLPGESELFLLPGRRALGLDPETGEAAVMEETAVAAFVSPGHTLAAHAAFEPDADAPVLPMFAYAGVGYEDGKFWVTARKVDEDPRQQFASIPQERIRQGARRLQRRFPENRLVRHLMTCALTYSCPAARNLALGRFEAPLPTSRACNARCVGCISLQPEDSGFPATQNRIAFTPTAAEIKEVMQAHGERVKEPVYSFGQGCEGEPLTEAELIAEAVRDFRAAGGRGTVNVNTNASRPEVMPMLAEAGLTSIRATLCSARKELYEAYHRPQGYAFEDVHRAIGEARRLGLFVSLNLLFFPGVTDTEAELAALIDLVREHRVDFIQLRNLNIDPDLYLELTEDMDLGPSVGLANFRKRLKKACEWVGSGYFNPWVETSR